jgi:parvulin-like peptidyl-prolyl isomerase
VKPLSRAVAAPVALLAAALVLVGCGNSSSSPGAAAVVGIQRISTDTLQRTVDRALRDPQAKAKLGADRARFVRDELGRLINNDVISAAAAAHGITVSNTEIDTQLGQFAQQAGGQSQLEQSAAQNGVPKEDLRNFIRFYVMQQKLADKLVADVPVTQTQLQAAYQKNIDQFDQVHSAHILVKDKKTADKVFAQVKQSPGDFAKLAAKYSQDTSNKNSGGDLGFAGHGQFVKAFSDAIFAAKPGAFLEVHSQFGWHVVHVIARKKVTLQQATPQLKNEVLKTQRDALLKKTLADEAKKLGIHVNPRYGKWDATNGQVVPLSGKSDVSSPAPTGSASG